MLNNKWLVFLLQTSRVTGSGICIIISSANRDGENCYTANTILIIIHDTSRNTLFTVSARRATYEQFRLYCLLRHLILLRRILFTNCFLYYVFVLNHSIEHF